MKFSLFLCLYIPCLLAERSSLEDKTVSALHATYEDTTLQLSGEVKVEHGLGVLQSDKAFLYRQESSKNLPFSRIYLEDNVHILCKDSASLSCDLAELDFQSLKGKLHSTSMTPVLYADEGVYGSTTCPIQLESKEIDLVFEKQEAKDGSIDYLCKQALASKEVVIRYAKDFAIQTPKACFSKNSSTEGKFFTDTENKSTILYKDETIEASYIEGSLENQTLQLKQPKGTLPSSLFSPKQQGQLFFSCQNLLWEHGKQILFLQGNVQIQESHFGCLTAENQVTIEQSRAKNTPSIQSIYVEGLSILSHNRSSLTSYGSLTVDGIKGQITAKSPSAGEQVLFEDPDLILKTDLAILEYTEPLHELSSLTFQGNIKIYTPSSLQTSRYALADRLVYAPDTKTIILSAYSGKRVLFWDEESKVTLSAKEVHITQNPITHKPDIKGVGNVKLVFSQEEQQLMKQHFPSIPVTESNP